MSGWAFLAQMLNSRDQDKRQEEDFKQRRSLMSQASVDRASERAFDSEASTKNSLSEYEGKKKIDTQYADQEATNAAKKAVAAHYASLGIPAEALKQGDEIFEAARTRYLDEAKAASQKAKTEGLGSEIKREGLGQTRDSDLSRLFSESKEGAFRAGESEKFARNNPKALEAGMFGREVAPAAALARSNTMSVGPGEYLKRFATGNPVVDSLFSPAEGRGATQNEVTTMQNFGGMQIPHTSKVTTPGTIEQTPPPTPKAALNGQNAPSPVMPQQQGRISLLSKPPTDMSQFQFSTPQFRNGQLQSNATMPEDPIAEQERKKKEAAEAIMNLQRLFSQPQYTPNSINR